MSLQLSDKFSLPREAALWTFAFLAIKGAGKTYDSAKLAEQMIKANIPIVVLDPMGIWWGLRVGVSGEGLPVVIFGGDHADLPIPTTISKDKRHQIIDEDKLRQAVIAMLQAHLSVVFDTSQLSITQQTRAVSIFCDTLYHKNAPYGIRHVFIEEADEYCPQEPKGEKQASKEAIDQLVRRGGNPNIGVTMITQRAAVLNKNVLSQTSCLFVLRIQWMKDKNTIREWVKDAVKDEREVKKLAKWYDSLKELKNGEAWVYSPEHDLDLVKVQFGERETLHATREYFLKETWEQKNITLRDVTSFVKAYKAKIEPKPTVKIIQPSVASQIGSFPPDYTMTREGISTNRQISKPSEKSTEKPMDNQRFETVKTVGIDRQEYGTERENRKEAAGVGTNQQDPTDCTVGKTPSQIHNTEPTLDKVEMRIPTEQKAQVQVHIPSAGPSEGIGRTQYGPTLAAPPTSSPEASSDTVIQQSLPTIEIHQTRPVLRLPVEALNEPTTIFGRLAVILYNDPNDSNKWTVSRMVKDITDHGWDATGLDQAVEQFLRWEILKKVVYNRRNFFKVDRSRITVVQVSPLVGLA